MRILLILFLFMLLGCATPPPLKLQACYMENNNCIIFNSTEIRFIYSNRKLTVIDDINTRIEGQEIRIKIINPN